MNATLKVTTSGDREILISREFDASRDLVWEALCKPEFLRRWLLGPPGWEMTVCEDEQKVGGKFRYAWKNNDGQQLVMHGVIMELTPPERIVRTESFDMGCPGQAGEQLATLVLTEKGNRTLLTITVLYPSKEARDGMLASGMDQGMEAGYQRLDALLAESVR